MQKAAVSELKASLSEYLGRVKAGEDLLITDRGRPVAKIIPLPRENGITPELVALEKAGLVKIGRGGLPEGFWNMNRPLDSKGAARASLREERENGR
jgi:prevent-host-death family protein